MGVLTLTGMVNSVFAQVDEPAVSDTQVTNKTRLEITRTVDDINDGYARVWASLSKTERPIVSTTLTTVAGTASYAAPSGTTAKDITAIQLVPAGTAPGPQAFSSEIRNVNFGEISAQYDLSVQGTPEVWYITGTQIGFYPVPNAAVAYRLLSAQPFVALTTGTDTTPFPAEVDMLLKQYATGRAKLFWKDADASLWLNEFEQGLQLLRADARTRAPRRRLQIDFDMGNSPGSSWYSNNTLS